MPWHKRFLQIALSIPLLLLAASCGGGLPVMPTSPSSTDTPTSTASPLPTDTPTPTITPIPISGICSPLTNHPLEQIPSIVSWSFNPIKGVGHYGVDITHWRMGNEASAKDDPVQAVMDGRVAGETFDRPPYGNSITVETPYSELPPALIEKLGIAEGESVYVLLAHLEDTPDIAIGQPVTCGQALDRVGMTGWAAMPHLHVETRFGAAGFTFTAMAYASDTSAEEMANYRTWFYNGQYKVFDPMILLSLDLP